MIGRTLREPIGVNLTSNPVRDCGLTIRPRSPLAPLKKGGTGVFSKSPFLRGFRGIWTRIKAIFLKDFRLVVDTNGQCRFPTPINCRDTALPCPDFR